MPHPQVFARVNAPVDEGIADLVSALSDLPSLCTQSSCEGAAFVTFRFGRNLAEASTFLCCLSRRLVTVSGASITAQWGGRDTLVLTLRCHPSSVAAVAQIVRSATTS